MNSMKKEIGAILLVVVVIAAVVYWAMNNAKDTGVQTQTPTNTTVPTGTTTSNTSTRPPVREPSRPGQVTGAITVKVDKVEGQKIFYTVNKVQFAVTVGSNTKIVQQSEVKGVYKDVVIPVTYIKAGQFVEMDGVTIAGAVTQIRVLD